MKLQLRIPLKKNKLKLLDLDISHKTKTISNYTEETNQLTKKINELELEISKVLPNNIHKLDEIKSKITLSDQELRSVLTRLVESKSKIRSSEEIQEQIQKLDICPTCKQNVSQEYITNVITTGKNLISALKIKITKLESEYSTKESEITKLKHELEIIQEHENQLKQVKLKKELLEEILNKNN
jgi:DNA repair exonuclease SbcCD ATPase subunit